MKKNFTALVCLVLTTQAIGQWQGTNPVYFDAGYVGIGTSSPQGYLHVNPVRPIILKNNGGNGIYGSEIGFNSVLLTSSVPNQFKKLGGTSQYGGANMAVDYYGNILFQMYSANTESESIVDYNPQIVFNNSGNVGIGTTTPNANLQIGIGTENGLVNLGGYAHVGSLRSSGDFFAGMNVFAQYNSSAENSKIKVLNSNSYGFSAVQMSYNGDINFYGKAGSVLANDQINISSNSRLTILGNGNVGIGISPNAKLDVDGTINASNSISGVQYITVNKNGSYRVAMNGQGDGYMIGRDDLSIDKFLIHSNGNSFLNGGNVGIGTTSPDAKLTVKGTIHAQQINVDLDGAIAPDYVFEPDYKLLSLEEIKSYIEKHKHLPEVPTAKEMETNGVNVSEMNMLLLKKIEELTLYVIELKKENDKQNKLIQDLTTNNK